MMEEMEKVRSYSGNKTGLKLLLLSLFIGLGAGLYFYEKKDSPKEDYTYITKTLKKEDLSLKVSATGYLQPLEEVEVGSEVSGTVKAVYVDFNDAVSKGQALARLDATKYYSALNRAKASLNMAKAGLENMKALLYRAQSTLERNKELKKSTHGSLPSQSDWDRDYANYLSAKAQLQSAQAQVEQAKESVVSARYDLKKTTIYSPISGTVLLRNVDVGQTVAASFQTPVLFKIAKDLKKMQLEVRLDEADIAKIKATQKASFSVDAYPSKTFDASIKMVRVNSEVVDGVVTYKAILNVNNDALMLKPGMSADVDIQTKIIHNHFVVPKAALLYIPVSKHVKKMFGSPKKEKSVPSSAPHIWILKNKEPHKIEVKVLGSSGSLSVVDAPELQEGDQVIIMQELRP